MGTPESPEKLAEKTTMDSTSSVAVQGRSRANSVDSQGTADSGSKSVMGYALSRRPRASTMESPFSGCAYAVDKVAGGQPRSRKSTEEITTFGNTVTDSTAVPEVVVDATSDPQLIAL